MTERASSLARETTRKQTDESRHLPELWMVPHGAGTTILATRPFTITLRAVSCMASDEARSDCGAAADGL